MALSDDDAPSPSVDSRASIDRAPRRGRTSLRARLGLAGVALACALAIASAAPPPAYAQPTSSAGMSNPAPSRPNILFVLVDDMGFGDLSIMGNRKVQTHNLDRLAREGVLMTRFYDPAPICSSSRAGFLTGRFPASLGFVGITAARARNAELGQSDWLDPELPNLARMLKSAGYTTAHIGKWHLGGGRDIADAPWPTAYGFDHSFTTFEGLGPRVLVSDEERDLAEQSDRLGQGPRFWEIKRELTRLYCDLAIAHVARHADQPWFVNLWLNDIHDPWAPDDDAAAETMGKGASADEDRMLATLVRMDRTLGTLFRRLDQMGELNDTLVIVTSDNGPPSLQRYYQRDGSPPGSAGDLRGRKFSLYEGGIRQPLILHWRGRTRAGTRDETTVAHGVDIVPTVAAIIGVRPPTGDGMDLSPVLAGRPVARQGPLFWAFGKEGRPPIATPFRTRDKSPRFAVREGDWKLLADDGGRAPQLYDLAADPSEATDLAANKPAIRDRLLDRLKRWLASLPK